LPEIEIGELRHRVTFEAPTGTAGYESVVEGIPAAIRMAGGNELLRFGAQTAVAAFVITMRYRTDVRPEWRVALPAENRVFQITNYGDPDGHRQWTQVFATEIQ
jgi:SPP1 family predicted phage head-tail adaptor